MDRAARLAEHHDEFLRFLARRLPRDVAEDLLHEVFVRGITKADDLRDDEAIVAWFYRALRNATVDHHRRRGASERALAAFLAELDTQLEVPDGTMRAEVCQCVTRVTRDLRPDYAHALQRIEVDGIAVKDFATEEGITAGNAAVRVHRAREALRVRLAQTCGPCAKGGCMQCTCAHEEKV